MKIFEKRKQSHIITEIKNRNNYKVLLVCMIRKLRYCCFKGIYRLWVIILENLYFFDCREIRVRMKYISAMLKSKTIIAFGLFELISIINLRFVFSTTLLQELKSKNYCKIFKYKLPEHTKRFQTPLFVDLFQKFPQNFLVQITTYKKQILRKNNSFTIEFYSLFFLVNQPWKCPSV